MRWPRLAHFAAAGAVGTVAHYALLVALVEGGGAGPVAASVAGFVLGALVNYALARSRVFRSGRPHREALPRFFAIAASGALLNALFMQLLALQLALPYLLAQLTSTGVLLFWHYALNAVWTFREARR